MGLGGSTGIYPGQQSRPGVDVCGGRAIQLGMISRFYGGGAVVTLQRWFSLNLLPDGLAMKPGKFSAPANRSRRLLRAAPSPPFDGEVASAKG